MKRSWLSDLQVLFIRREFMQRLYAALHGTMGSYLRDAFQEGSAEKLWHAFPFLGLMFSYLFFFLLGGLHCFFFKKIVFLLDLMCLLQ
jgi:hypothetical protein